MSVQILNLTGNPLISSCQFNGGGDFFVTLFGLITLPRISGWINEIC